MTDPLQPEILDTLVCEPASRPRGAPTLGEIVPAVRAARRDALSLTVTFDRSAAELVGAVVAAERLCCPTLTWELAPNREPTGEPVLRIAASPGQLDVLEAIFAPPHSQP